MKNLSYYKKHFCTPSQLDLIVAILIFGLFFVCLLIQHFTVFLYHDDYGYAALNYVVNVDVEGLNYQLNDILSFLWKHYLNVNGRLSGFLVEISLIHVSVNAIRIAQSAMLLGIFVFLWLLSIQHQKSNRKLGRLSVSAFMAVCCYGLFGIDMATGGLYWFSASMAFVVPLVIFYFIVYIMDVDNRLVDCVCGLLLFFASCSHEVVSSYFVAFFVLYSGCRLLKDKRFYWRDWIFTLIALIGFLVVVIAPGNFVRMQSSANVAFYQMSFIHRAITNIPYIIRLIYNKENLFFVSYFTILTLVCTINNLKNKKSFFNLIINLLTLFSSIVIIVASTLCSSGFYDYIHSHVKIYNPMMLLIIMLSVFSICEFLYNQRRLKSLMLFFAALLSLCSLVMAPSDVHCRVTFPFDFTVFLLLVEVIVYYLQNEKPSNKSIILVVVIALSVCPFVNEMHIYYGYKSNKSINEHNDVMCVKTSKLIKSGEKINEIHLLKLKDDRYADYMPYRATYIYEWIKEYYDLPNEVKIIYSD